MEERVSQKHKKVSDIPTPRAYIFKKGDDHNSPEYVKFPYMRSIANKEYPIWNFTVINTGPVGDKAWYVHGRLEWVDNGIKRQGDMVAAHRIQVKRGTSEYVDIGNDIKAAVTDCQKKAFNVYLNISDDIYRSHVDDMELSEKQINEIMDMAKSAGKEEKIASLIESGEIAGHSYEGSLAKLKRQSK